MRARYFGPSTRRLFGVFDEPAPGRASELGAVLCYPYGADYDSAFRSFRRPFDEFLAGKPEKITEVKSDNHVRYYIRKA